MLIVNRKSQLTSSLTSWPTTADSKKEELVQKKSILQAAAAAAVSPGDVQKKLASWNLVIQQSSLRETV